MVPVTFDEIRPLFGLRIDAPDVLAFFKRSPEHTKRKPYQGDQYVIFKSLGFDLLFRSPGFASPPFGIDFADPHDRLVKQLGQPPRSNMPGGVNDSILCWLLWDRWEID